MNVIAVEESKLKDVVKAAIVELFEERQDLLSSLLGEAFLDLGLAYAIQAGERTAPVSREEVFEIFEVGM